MSIAAIAVALVVGLAVFLYGGEWLLMEIQRWRNRRRRERLRW